MTPEQYQDWCTWVPPLRGPYHFSAQTLALYAILWVHEFPSPETGSLSAMRLDNTEFEAELRWEWGNQTWWGARSVGVEVKPDGAVVVSAFGETIVCSTLASVPAVIREQIERMRGTRQVPALTQARRALDGPIPRLLLAV